MSRLTHRTKHGTSSAFTLIELLVVVAIIALLIAILMPALAKAKASAEATDCLSKIKALNTGLIMYNSEWDGSFPPNGIIMPKNGPIYTVTDPQQWVIENGALWPIMNKNKAAYMCKTDANNSGWRINVGGAGTGNCALVKDSSGTVHALTAGDPTWGNASAGGYWSYSVNTILNSNGRFRQQFSTPSSSGFPGIPWNDPLKVTGIKRPTEFISFIEEGDSSDFNDEVFEPPAYSPGTVVTNLITNRHSGNGNLAWMDGHAETIKAVPFNNVNQVNPTPTLPAPLTMHQDAFNEPYTKNFFPDEGDFVSAAQ